MEHLNHLAHILEVLILGFVIVGAVMGFKRDDTDSKATRERSGLILYRDHGTGQEYVAAPTWFGLSRTPLVPRAQKQDNKQQDSL